MQPPGATMPALTPSTPGLDTGKEAAAEDGNPPPPRFGGSPELSTAPTEPPPFLSFLRHTKLAPRGGRARGGAAGTNPSSPSPRHRPDLCQDVHKKNSPQQQATDPPASEEPPPRARQFGQQWGDNPHAGSPSPAPKSRAGSRAPGIWK